MPRTAIGHIDADCYYVSAERVRDRFLLDKAVGVLGNQGACVIAKSYEMKALGVTTGEPIWEAKKKCPQGIYLKRDFRWYEILSREMLGLLRTHAPQVEYYSIDEFFLRLEPLRGQSWQATAEAIRDALWHTVHVPATIGIARSKTLAKLISDTAKPFGALAVLDPEQERALLASRPVSDITGIAARRAARLAPYGIHTCLDLANADRKPVRQLLTKVGEILCWELHGEQVQQLHTQRPPHKVLSRGGSLGESTCDPERIWAWVVRNLERLIEELAFYSVRPGCLELILCCHDGPSRAAGVQLPFPTQRFDVLADALRYALAHAWMQGVEVNRMHLLATDLHWPGCVQGTLFDPPPDKAEAVAVLKQAINARFGRFKLRSGATLPLTGIYKDEAQGFDICDVRGKMCF